MTSNRRKPDFLIIGVQKSATTWLQERLRQHPDVFMPRNEVHYFDRDENFAKGENWYLGHFDEAADHQLIGEKTPDYIWTNCASTPGVSELKHKRIHEFHSDIKLIVIFRNPIERFVSALHHNRRRGRVPAHMSVGEILKSEQYKDVVARMLEPGLYATQLKDYLEIFDRNQIKILFHDDIKFDPDAVLSAVQEFLGVERRAFGDIEKKRYNDYKATEIGATLLGKTDGLLKDLVIKLDRYCFSRLPVAKIKYPTLSESDRVFLTDHYCAEVRELPELVGRDLPPGWVL